MTGTALGGLIAAAEDAGIRSRLRRDLPRADSPFGRDGGGARGAPSSSTRSRNILHDRLAHRLDGGARPWCDRSTAAELSISVPTLSQVRPKPRSTGHGGVKHGYEENRRIWSRPAARRAGKLSAADGVAISAPTSRHQRQPRFRQAQLAEARWRRRRASISIPPTATSSSAATPARAGTASPR